MEHLGRADAVEDVDAEALAPALADVRGSASPAEVQTRSAEPSARLAGSASSEAKSVGTPQKMVGCVLGEAARDGGRRRALGHEHGGRADAEREGERVAEAVGEEELRRREDEVVLADAEDAAP